MRAISIISITLVLTFVASAQWTKYDVKTNASFRGLSVVNEKVVWASGTNGTFIRTVDGGKTWDVRNIPGSDNLDFRDVEAFDANTAYVLSIGNGESSRIYKTTDGGKNWNEQFRNKNAKAFFDAIACWDKNNCIAVSDPVDHKFVLIETKDGGSSWTPIDTSKMPAAKDGESAFAASGTCLITQGNDNAFLVTGGNAARVFRSADRGHTWQVADTPIVSGSSGSGIFSIAMRDSKDGVIVGGNYEKPSDVSKNIAFTRDGGVTWTAMGFVQGYRSGVAYIHAANDKNTIIAVGTTGSDRVSLNMYLVIDPVDSGNYNAIASKKDYVWAVGPKGLVVGMITNQFGI
jgi:photosystem II stability/assembly factor-like uncharacterized protein